MTQPTDTTPAGGAARGRDRVLAQARFETVTLLRNGEQLLVAIVLPAMALVGLALSQTPSAGAVCWLPRPLPCWPSSSCSSW